MHYVSEVHWVSLPADAECEHATTQPSARIEPRISRISILSWPVSGILYEVQQPADLANGREAGVPFLAGWLRRREVADWGTGQRVGEGDAVWGDG